MQGGGGGGGERGFTIGGLSKITDITDMTSLLTSVACLKKHEHCFAVL